MKLDATYTTPDQTHAMMEPFASIAAWKGDELTVWTANQMIDWARNDLAKTLQMDPAKVRVVSPYIGGGFGGKLFLRSDVLLAALGARAAKRPVKVALTRPLMANNSTHRPATIQRVRLGATADGKITAFAHETWSGNLPGGSAEMGILASRALVCRREPHDGHAARGARSARRQCHARARRCAGIDGVRDRHRRNGAQAEPRSRRIPRPATTRSRIRRSRRACTPRASWSNACAPARRSSAGIVATRSPARCATAAGSWGMGVATAYRGAPVLNSAARVRLDAQGVVTVETDMTDIGTGSYTIIQQTAAEMMGVPLERVVVKLGDSRFPVSAGSGGQFGAVSATSGVYAACVKLREAVAQKLGVDPATADFVGRHRRRSAASVCRWARPPARQGLAGEDKIEFVSDARKIPAVHLRRAFRRSRRRLADRGDARAPHAGGVFGGANPESQGRAQPDHRRHDHGRGRRAHGRPGGRQARRDSS